jgi:hypothetical protein
VIIAKDHVIYVHNEHYLAIEERNYVIWRKMDETGNHQIEQNKPSSI